MLILSKSSHWYDIIGNSLKCFFYSCSIGLKEHIFNKFCIWKSLNSQGEKWLQNYNNQHPWFTMSSFTWNYITWKHLPCYWPFMRGIHERPCNMEIWVSFHVSFNKLLNKQSSCWWFGMPWCLFGISVISKIFHFIWKVITGTCNAGISLGKGPANKRRHYNVTMSLIDWVYT